MDLQPVRVHFEQNIEIQHKCSLSLGDGTRITNPGVAIRTWVEMGIQRPMMERKE